MHLESPAFEAHQTIPQKFTCDGEDVSPALNIQDIPKGTQSLVLIVDDPDAPHGVFVHWLAWNIEPTLKNFPEGMSPPSQGRNGFGELDYRGPCPPKGNPHRYFFKLYALDNKLNLPAGSSKRQLEDAIKGHILGKAELVGLYQRQ
jgi:Raf kinase inhibitor-like YbhB/YbcL family protein